METSKRLLSLWDMLKLPIASLIGSFMHITDFGRVVNDASINSPGQNIYFSPSIYSDLTRNVNDFLLACEKTELLVTLNAAKEFKKLLDQIRQPTGSGVIAEEQVTVYSNYAIGVIACFTNEAETRHLLSVPNAKVKFFEPTEPLFGSQVAENFPLAVDDIADAGRCLALGQGTAAVMHLMRVVEVGLKAVANGLKIPYAPSWESYLTQIGKKISEKATTKPKSWKRQEKFYRDVSGDLLTIKNAWRNPTMHVDRKYFPDEAEVIFLAVETFMRRLATKVKSKK